VTVLELIDGSLKLIGVLSAGETANANDAEDARLRLNDFLDYLATQRLTIYNQQRSTYSLINGQAAYTIGTSGTPDFNQTRPLWIDNLGIIIDGSPDNEIQIPLMTRDQYASIIVKDVTSPLPSAAYYNQTYPNGTLTLWPVPSDATVDLAIYWPSQSLASVAALATTLSIPPGWALMLRYNLAKLLAPEFGRPLDGQIAMMADESLAAIKRTNMQPQDLSMDAGLLLQNGRPWNIYTGDYSS
jgi:hypothetical protein